MSRTPASGFNDGLNAGTITRDLLKRGAVLVDETDDGEELRALFYLEHAVQDGRIGRGGQLQVVSQRLQFVEIDRNGQASDAGPAPYLDYRPVKVVSGRL